MRVVNTELSAVNFTTSTTYDGDVTSGVSGELIDRMDNENLIF